LDWGWFYQARLAVQSLFQRSTPSMHYQQRTHFPPRCFISNSISVPLYVFTNSAIRCRKICPAPKVSKKLGARSNSDSRRAAAQFFQQQNAVAAIMPMLYRLRRRFAMSDQDIQNLESQFPAVSGSAFATAREQVLKSGQSVLQSENGVIPDGRRVEVKKIEPPTHFKTGSTFTIK
jgi:hypothetical protein